MMKRGNGFQYLKTQFLRISDVKVKEETFVGQKIRKFMNNPSFNTKPIKAQKRAWSAFVKV